MENVTVIDHPLVQHKLSLMRRKETPTAMFRQLLREISLLLGYEVTRDLPLEMEEIDTPMTKMQAPTLAGKKLVLISILRAGNGLLEGMLDLIPSARVGHVGLYRDPETLVAVEYYFKVPQELEDRQVIAVDPLGHLSVLGHRARVQSEQRDAPVVVHQLRFHVTQRAPDYQTRAIGRSSTCAA